MSRKTSRCTSADTSHTSRRRFVQAATGFSLAGGLVAAGTLTARAQAAPESGPPARTQGRSKIRIGVRFGEEWLHSPQDADLRFFKQIGVDYVDIELRLVKGYVGNGIFTAADLQALIDRLDAVGLKIERANALGPLMYDALIHRSEGQRQIDNLKRIAALVVDAKIPVLGVQCCQAVQHCEPGRYGWIEREGRGGYQYPDFRVARAAKVQPKVRVTSEQLWQGLLNIYSQVMPVVEGSQTNIAMHGNDPPLYEHLGNPQIVCRFADFERLFREVPSRHNGMTFCVGTRYESGEDVLEGIRRFGRQGKLFHVHFRNVRGTLPSQGGYSEVAVDDGDLKMVEVVRALEEVGYAGVIDYDHPIHMTGDQPLPKQYIAMAVGYMKGLIESL